MMNEWTAVDLARKARVLNDAKSALVRAQADFDAVAALVLASESDDLK